MFIIFAQFVVENAFGVLSFPVAIVFVATVADDVRHDTEKGQLLVVAGQALVLRVVQFARPVVVEDVSENVRIAVEEIFFRLFVVKEFTLVRAE